MDSFYFDLALSVLFSTIKASVKNEASKAKLKRALLKLRNQINALYFGDPDFDA